MCALQIGIASYGDCPLGLQYLSGQAIRDALPHRLGLRIHVLGGANVQFAALLIEQHQRPLFGADHINGRFHHPLQDFLQIKR